jgi:hypothetical protein
MASKRNMAGKRKTAKRKVAKKRAAPSRRMLAAETEYLGKRLDDLKAAARSAEAGVKTSTEQQIRLLKRKHVEVKQALERLTRQSVAASTTMTTGLQKAWRDVEVAVRLATKRFRETT